MFIAYRYSLDTVGKLFFGAISKINIYHASGFIRVADAYFICYCAKAGKASELEVN